jgi:hypothetical protein
MNKLPKKLGYPYNYTTFASDKSKNRRERGRSLLFLTWYRTHRYRR